MVIVKENKMNKKLLVLGAILVVIIVGLVINGQVNAKVKEEKVKAKDKDIVCEYAVPPQGCDWTNITPYPECGGMLVCEGQL